MNNKDIEQSQEKNNMAGKLVLFHALPGAGKTTEAMRIMNEDPQNVIRANRDDIREIVAPEGAEYHKKTPRKDVENNVSHVQKEIIQKGLREGKTVIVDDTNLNPRRIKPLVEIAKKYKAEIDQVHVDTPLEECIRRNNKRGDEGGRRVPEEVIRGMAKNAYGNDGHLKEFIIADNGNVFAVERNTEGMKKVDEFNDRSMSKNPPKGKAVVILDMDGTLFNNEADSARYLNQSGQKRDFHNFYTSITKAPVNTKVRDLVNSMYDNDDLTIVAVTGRTDDYAAELIEALDNSGAKVSQLIMKKAEDGRPSSEHKRDTIDKLQKQGLIVSHAIEDRDMDLKMFAQKGIMTTQVQKNAVDPNNILDTYPEPEINTVYGSGYCIRCGSKLKNGGNIGRVCATKAKL